MRTVLTVPGLWNSGPEHWQTLWEAAEPSWGRVQQPNWQTAVCDEWVEALDSAVRTASGLVVLVAHSLGCVTVARWAKRGRRIGGALLVAPTDVEAEAFPPGTHGFSPMPLERLPFPSTVAASTNDPYVSPERAIQFAHAWGSVFENVGARGHVNAASGLSSWPEGRALLDRLLRGGHEIGSRRS